MTYINVKAHIFCEADHKLIGQPGWLRQSAVRDFMRQLLEAGGVMPYMKERHK